MKNADFMSAFLLMRWDIFCKVIDNYGDIGVCWRLGRQLAARGERVRLWVDDAKALVWMAPQGCAGVEVCPWNATQPQGLEKSDVLIEAFGCDIPDDGVKALVHENTCWINLEYLSAESYVERSHGLPSPVMSGPLQGWVKHFFYPGFTPKTGGLLREPDLLQRQQAFDRSAWFSAQGLEIHQGLVVSLFCYEPKTLPGLLAQLAQQHATLLVTAGRATQIVKALSAPQGLEVRYLPHLNQDDYDHLLWSCDLNFVRGEDSLVRALWSGKAFVWQIYPQDDNAHHAKLKAFLDWMQAPSYPASSLRAFHEAWNGLDDVQALPALDLAAWDEAARKARDKLLAQPDLVSQLLAFVKKR